MILRSRLRRTAKWTMAVIALLLVLAWIGSGWWHIAYRSAPGRMVYVSEGVAAATFTGGFGWVQPPLGWDVGPHPFRLRWGFAWDRNTTFSHTAFPLWAGALIAACAAGYLWRRDARARHANLGVCGVCGYDRTGLASGAVCPECGEPHAQE